MLKTGLRVSELSQIKKEDCTITDDSIEFSFIGKGGKEASSQILKLENERLFNSLHVLIQDTKPGYKVFYSANYLQKKQKKEASNATTYAEQVPSLNTKKLKA